MLLFGIAAEQKQSGKDTFADLVKEEMETLSGGQILFLKFSYADALKQFLIAGKVLKKEQGYGTEEEKNTFTDVLWRNQCQEVRDDFQDVDFTKTPRLTGRQVMQVFGTNIMRKMFGQLVWLNHMESALKEADNLAKHQGKFLIAAIPDVRFPNELHHVVQDQDGVSVFIHRIDHPLETDSHSSEGQMKSEDCDLTYSAKDIAGLKIHAQSFIKDKILPHVLELVRERLKEVNEKVGASGD